MSHKRSCKGNPLIGKIKNIGQRKVQQRGIKWHKLEMIIFCYEYNSDWYIETYMNMKQVPTLCLSQANVIGNEDTRINTCSTNMDQLSNMHPAFQRGGMATNVS